MGHGHGHAEGRAEDRRRLWVVLGVTVGVLALEVVGAALSGSLALLADAGHLLSDAAAVLLALGASYLAARPADDRRTFGYHRAEILAALANALLLLGVCGYLGYAGVRRLLDPPIVDAGPMLGFAVVALLANLLSAGVLASRRDASLNMRAAFLEVLGDALGSGAAVLAAGLVLTLGWQRADPLATLLIALLIAPRAVVLLGDAARVLFESTPAGIDLAVVRGHLLAMPGVTDVHALHAWTITSGMPSLSAHVTVTEECLAGRGVGGVLDALSRCAREDFGVEHATFQVEPQSHRSHEHLGGDRHA